MIPSPAAGLAHAQLPDSGLGVVVRRRWRMALLIFVTFALLIAGYIGWRYYQFREHLDEGRRATSEGRVTAAREHLRFCEGVDAESREVMLLAARIDRMTQSWAGAEETLEHYWRLHGDDDRLTFERLLLKAARDDADAVAGPLGIRIAEGGESARFARHALASGYIREFRYGEAQAVVEAWATESPDDPLAELLRGKLHEQQFRFEDAARTYAGIAARIPEHHEARLKLVVLLMQHRRADEALGHLVILRDGLPDHAEVAVQWALALRQVGHTDESAKSLDEALARFPDSPTALTERGTLALNAGDDRLAADSLAKALRFDPGATGARSLYAQALTRLGRTAKAARELETIRTLTADSDRLTELIHGPLQTRPDDPTPPFEIGGIALRAGQPGEAIRWYQAALKRDPHHPSTHTALAVIYHEMGNPVLATQHRALAASGGGRR